MLLLWPNSKENPRPSDALSVPQATRSPIQSVARKSRPKLTRSGSQARPTQKRPKAFERICRQQVPRLVQQSRLLRHGGLHPSLFQFRDTKWTDLRPRQSNAEDPARELKKPTGQFIIDSQRDIAPAGGKHADRQVNRSLHEWVDLPYRSCLPAG